MSILSPADLALLETAARQLESQSLAMKIATAIGMPVEKLLHMLPAGAQASVSKAVNKALERCLDVALQVSRSQPALVTPKFTHTAAVAVTGAVGGFFGLPGMLVELPITTTVMLHSIVEIARRNGEDLSQPEAALACLAVFALGPQGVSAQAIDSAYYVTRAALAQVTRDAAVFLAQKGTTKETAPVLISFLSRVAARFGLEVGEKLAAELVPIAGAAGGLAVNVLFNNHFEALAQGHFTVRRLERQYGADAVREAYEGLRPRAAA